jgi:PspA/IM30 family
MRSFESKGVLAAMALSTHLATTNSMTRFSSVMAFVPSCHGPVSSCNGRQHLVPFVSNGFGGSLSSTSLSMNLFDRFSRVAKSNLNNILKTLEDPEKIMTQALEDMQVCLQQNKKMSKFFLIRFTLRFTRIVAL